MANIEEEMIGLQNEERLMEARLKASQDDERALQEELNKVWKSENELSQNINVGQNYYAIKF